MKVVYTAPNRGHHYRYALALHEAGVLYKFVSGFSRWSPRAAFPEIGNELVRADTIQNLFLASLKFKMPVSVTAHLAYLAKIEQDRACKNFINDADIFMFYNGSGLGSCRQAAKKGKISIVEAVNSHVHYQEQLLKDEYKSINLPWHPFHTKEKQRRMDEYELADYILMPSEFVKRSFIEMGFSPDKLIKVPYGFNHFAGTHDENEQTGQADFVILYVGSISVRKGLRYLIEAFEQFKHPRKKLMIVGPESQPNGIKDITIPKGVVFTGVLKGADLENAYKGASVFCLPSLEEGLALVLGEALSFGIPIIATENTGADDIITSGQEGFIVPIKSSKQITEKLQLLADDSILYKQMKQNAVKKAADLKGWDETGRLLNASLQKIYNKQKANS